MQSCRWAMLAVACWLAVIAELDGDQWHCPVCGCCEFPFRTRRLVPDVERVVQWEYFQRCETWCVQGPSRCVGEVRKSCCDPNCNVPQYDKIWEPRCGPAFTAARLCKRPVVVERPVLRCVTEDVCTHCGRAQAATEAHPVWARRGASPTTVSSSPAGGIQFTASAVEQRDAEIQK